MPVIVSSFLSRKSLLFLCVSVASVVLAPFMAHADTSDFRQTNILLDEYVGFRASTTASVITTYGNEVLDDDVKFLLDSDFTGQEALDDGYYIYVLYYSTFGADSIAYLIGHSAGTEAGTINVATASSTATDGNFHIVQTRAPFLDNTAKNNNWSYITMQESLGGTYKYAPIGVAITTTDLDVSSYTTFEQMKVAIEGLIVSYSTSTIDGSTFTFDGSLNTRFTDISITSSASSSVTIIPEYYLDGDELDPTLSERNPTFVNFQYALRPSTTISSDNIAITPTSGTSTATSTLTSLADGTYDLVIGFANVGSNLGLSSIPFEGIHIYTDFTLSGGNLTNVGAFSYSDRTQPPETSRYQDCSLTQIDNCLSNVGIFLFYPSEESLENFYTLRESISTKFPFNYVADFKNAFTGFYTTATTESLEITVPFGSFGDITLLSADLINDVPLASTIRLLLGYLLWIMLVYQIYRRTLKIFNSQETTTA